MHLRRARSRQKRLENLIGTAAVVALCLLGACASGDSLGRRDAIPPYTIVAIRDAGVRDLRGEFRAAVCARLEAGGPACENVLLRLAGESVATALPPVEGLAERYRVAFVPGLFSECFEDFARPFADAQADLQAKGFTVDYFQVAGRGSSARNAARLAEHFRATADDPRPLIVFAYSKGLVDLLEFMVRSPDEARQIAAVVTVAGAANGSPLADQMHAVYRAVGAAFPLPNCAPGTGEELVDLQPDTRIAWWQQHGESITVPIFALVAAPEPDRISPATRASYRQLAKVDVRNDGKLLWQDQIPPRSHLLGYVNADHWSIAVPVATGMPKASFLFRDETPRTALVGGALDVVARTLADSAAGGS
ncbi:MAG: hypothetical protein QG586_349 [Pseudomonadota bacterium]|nr:hypothetical protein [Pseudomonadota bacterium]